MRKRDAKVTGSMPVGGIRKQNQIYWIKLAIAQLVERSIVVVCSFGTRMVPGSIPGGETFSSYVRVV